MELSEVRRVERRWIEEVGEKFRERGWQVSNARPALLTRNFSIGVEFQIQVNSRISASVGSIKFIPALGVCHQEIDRLITLFFKLPVLSADANPSAGANLPELLPGDIDIFRWSVVPSRNERGIQELMISDIETYGMAFLRNVGTLDGLVDRLARKPSSQGRDEVLAIAYALAGSPSSARDVLSSIAARSRGESPLVLRQAEVFMESFAEYFQIFR
ncbi:hypothetical protein [Actinomadura sp. K4S16]|uniref:hypothetical protein n=1 Tax=Actinomadura sp. K4S16 TaxID=1316147 RepID=UPI0011ED24F6|nr:hypothetical protein [Actinomadura sp. K4S16]